MDVCESSLKIPMIQRLNCSYHSINAYMSFIFVPLLSKGMLFFSHFSLYDCLYAVSGGQSQSVSQWGSVGIKGPVWVCGARSMGPLSPLVDLIYRRPLDASTNLISTVSWPCPVSFAPTTHRAVALSLDHLLPLFGCQYKILKCKFGAVSNLTSFLRVSTSRLTV